MHHVHTSPRAHRRAHRGRGPGRRSRQLGRRHRRHQAGRRRRRTPHPAPAAARRQLRLPAHRRRRPPRTSELVAAVRRLTALGVLNPGVAYALGLIGLTTITASMSVLLWALEPVVIMLLAALVLREHIPLRSRLGSASPSPGCCWSSTSPAPPARPSASRSPWSPSVLRPVHGADPAPDARRLLAERGARPAGGRAGVRGRPGDGRRAGRRHRLGPRRARRRGTGWVRRPPGSCTTGLGS